MLPLLLFVVAVVFLRAGQARWIWWAVGLGGDLLLFLVLPIGIAMLFDRSHHGFRQRLVAVTIVQPETSTPTAMSSFISWVGLQSYTVLFVIFLVLFLSWTAGVGSAANQRVFFETKNTHNVLVADDGSNFVFETVSGCSSNNWK